MAERTIDWLERYRRVRAATEALCEPLAVEDHVIQTVAYVSPTKWHLAHTSWFFETFVLDKAGPGYEPVHPDYDFLFNSYYDQVGPQFERADRGLLSRPTVEQVYDYRRVVDERMDALLSGELDPTLAPVVELGLHHEQQHQELLLTDIKHVFARNPLAPVYRSASFPEGSRAPQMDWVEFDGGLAWIGHAGEGFAFDNEGPRHQVYLEPFELADRLVSVGEFRVFMEDGGYERPELWLSDGWLTAKQRAWRAPEYWLKKAGDWVVFTLSGLRPLDDAEPVCHVSLYEADAYARWASVRLATEWEWELAAVDAPRDGRFVETGLCHPVPAPRGEGVRQLMGDLWEWTGSAYLGYPGYRAPAGAIGEYNGKFMSGQMVLRGGSCVTPGEHIRSTYRNFFPPDARWQFSGIRLARDA